MSPEPSNPLPDDPVPSGKESSFSGSVTTSTTGYGTPAVETVQEDKEHMSSLSQKSSPKIPSILLPPHEPSNSRSRPRPSSLNLPKHARQLHRQNTNQPSPLGPSRKRVLSTHAIKNNQEVNVPSKGTGHADDGLLSFGDDYSLGPDNPEVLADVQRALKAKALREAHSTSVASIQSTSSSPVKSGPWDLRLSPESNILGLSPSPVYPATPPGPLASGPSRSLTPSSAPPLRTAFPYVHSPSRSVESISSESHSEHFPVPILVSLRDGSSYLDWSGTSLQNVPQKDKRFLGRTFSLTKRKGKEKDHSLRTGRNSLDSGASQGDLHAAQLDNIRRVAKRETLSRAETTRDELGRRYKSLVPHMPTGEPVLNPLDVVRSRGNGRTNAPWLAWSRLRAVVQPKASVWTITANSADIFLQKLGHFATSSTVASPFKPPQTSDSRSPSPLRGLSSPLSSSRSSISVNPNLDVGVREIRRSTELTRSLSASPVIEAVVSTSPHISPTVSRSLSLTQAPSVNLPPSPTAQPQRSLDAMLTPNATTVSFPNLSRSPRSSLDVESRPPSIPGPSKVEKDSLKKRVRVSLSGDRLAPTIEPRTSTMSSLTNMFNAPNVKGAAVVSGRLHLGVSNIFGMVRRSGEDNGEGRKDRSRSSDERDSGRDGEGTKSDDWASRNKLERAHAASVIDINRMRSHGQVISNTSDSDLGAGHLRSKLSRKFHSFYQERNRNPNAEGTIEDSRVSISENEQPPVDALATPRWTLKRSARHARASASREFDQEKLEKILRKQEEEEERLKEVYKARESMLIETNDHNRRVARLLKAVGASIREHELVESDLAQAVGAQCTLIPQEVLDAISADPATTLRHGKGWRAVEDSHQRFITQQAVLASYLSTLTATRVPNFSSELGDLIQEADALWNGLRVKREEIDMKSAVVKQALGTAVKHMDELQREYNKIQILVESDYPEQIRVADLETIITESRSPRGWLEFAAFWIPERVLEIIGGFIRFFGVPISEKFIRPFLWYFFRNRYYWKIYSTEPPPSERAWYTRLGYWVVILSILAWYTTA